MPQQVLTQMADDRRSRANDLGLLDAGMWLGRPRGFPLAREVPAAELPGLMARYFTRGGLVSHWRGAAESAQAGNACLGPCTAGWGEDLHAVWTALPMTPGQSGPLPGVDELPPHVGAARVFPRTHSFAPVDWCVGSLLRYLVEHRLPLLVWHTEIDLRDLHHLARAFPDLPVIVESQTRKIIYHTRTLFSLMEDCPNVMVELSNLVGQGLLEYVVNRFGAERLIYGSFLPVNDPLVPIGMLLDADITSADRALIAGGNLRRLMGEVRR